MTRFDEIKAKIQNKSHEQKEATRRDYKEFFDHPLLYVALISSGLLSALAGLAIGLGVHITDGNVTAFFDVGHVFFALIYSSLFPYFFEFGLSNWLNKFLHREPDNKVQFWTAAMMIGITFVGTAITAYAAIDVLITAGGFFVAFTEIPASVQRWVAFALPTMFMLNIASGELYRQFTTEAILTRSATNELKQDQIAADMEIKLAQMKAKKDIAVHSANEYSRHAEQDAPEIGRTKGKTAWQTEHAPIEVHPDKPFETKSADVELAELVKRVEELTAKVGSPKA